MIKLNKDEKQLTTKISKENMEWLKEEAKKGDKTIGEIVDLAISNLSNKPVSAEDKAKIKEQLDICFEKIKKVVGISGNLGTTLPVAQPEPTKSVEPTIVEKPKFKALWDANPMFSRVKEPTEQHKVVSAKLTELEQVLDENETDAYFDELTAICTDDQKIQSPNPANTIKTEEKQTEIDYRDTDDYREWAAKQNKSNENSDGIA